MSRFFVGYIDDDMGQMRSASLPGLRVPSLGIYYSDREICLKPTFLAACLCDYGRKQGFLQNAP